MLPKISIPNITPGSLPVTSFHFLVVFHGTKLPVPNLVDLRFQKVSGIEMTMPSVESKRVGGKLVKLASFPAFTNLVLERGYPTGLSPLKKELEADFENLKFCPRNVHVILLDTSSLPLASWLFFDAFPIRWSLSDLDASQSGILIETLELSYSRFDTISL